MMVLLALPAACTAPRGRSIVDEDPRSKIPAIKRAVREQDRSVVRQLVADLESDDPAVRFYAIKGLHELTGQDFGYRYYADEAERDPALQRWRQWLEEQEKPS